MSDLVDALEDLKSELRKGKTAESVVDSIAADYDLKPVFLLNRAKATLGDLATWAERNQKAHDALQPGLEKAKKKILLAKLENKMQTTKWTEATREEATDLAETINSLRAEFGIAGRWELRTKRVRKPADFDSLIRKFAKELGMEYPY